MSYSDNLDDVLDDYEGVKPTQEHEITWANVMEYAIWLQQTQGYFVFSPTEAAKEVRRQLSRLLQTGRPMTDETIVLALEAAGFMHLNWLLEKTGGTRPPVKAGEGRRQARQGGWSDVTGNLANAYKFRINGGALRENPGGSPTEPPPEGSPLPF